MGQKTNPISNRIGITRGWDSNWCGGNYAEKIAEDYKIREYLGNRLAKASLSKIVIERTLKLITVTIYAARPGFIIGKGGQEVDKLKEELKKVTSKDIQINIYEVKRPEVDAHISAIAAPSRWLSPTLCVSALKASRFRSQVAWAAPKWPAARCSKRVVPLCTPSAQTSTTLWQ